MIWLSVNFDRFIAEFPFSEKILLLIAPLWRGDYPALGLITSPVLRLPAIQAARENNPHLVLSAFVMMFLLLGSFGYGRVQAEHLIRDKELNAQITLEAGVESGKLLGKLGSHYFLLNASNRVSVFPEQSIKRIEYRKEHKSSG